MSEIDEGFVRIATTLISVSDKRGVVDFAKFLKTRYDTKIISTGGTAKVLRDAGIHVEDVSEITGFPECLGGRVKTMHPKLMGGVLYRRHHRDDEESVNVLRMEPIDLVVVNLYPFEKTIQKPGVTFDEAIEEIDIGGPTLLRSAAKNHRFVTVASKIEHYDLIRNAMIDNRGPTTSRQLRHHLAAEAIRHTSEYDKVIADYLESTQHGTA
ncbi:MAG: hypothetical protein AAB381_01035 [Patescibacteria group bacterium]